MAPRQASFFLRYDFLKPIDNRALRCYTVVRVKFNLFGSQKMRNRIAFLTYKLKLALLKDDENKIDNIVRLYNEYREGLE